MVSYHELYWLMIHVGHHEPYHLKKYPGATSCRQHYLKTNVALLVPQTKHHVVTINLFKTSLWFLSHVFQCLCASPTASQCQGDLQDFALWLLLLPCCGPGSQKVRTHWMEHCPLDRSHKLEHRMSFYHECIYSRYFSLTFTYFYDYIYIYVCSIDS